MRVTDARRAGALRWAASAAWWTIIGAALGIALAVTAPLAFGFRSLTVLSGSMEPLLRTGDVVVVATIPPSRARVGDVVTFPDPENGDRLITHRVRYARATVEDVRFVTRGDANTGEERWSVPRDGTIGRVTYRVPKLGYVLHAVRSPAGRVALVAIPATLLAAYALSAIWRPEREGAT